MPGHPGAAKTSAPQKSDRLRLDGRPKCHGPSASCRGPSRTEGFTTEDTEITEDRSGTTHKVALRTVSVSSVVNALGGAHQEALDKSFAASSRPLPESINRWLMPLIISMKRSMSSRRALWAC